jgi:membrane-bound serine protease (ClpP class)
MRFAVALIFLAALPPLGADAQEERAAEQLVPRAQVQEERAAEHLVLHVRLDDSAITPMTDRFLARVIEEADERNAEVLLIELDTPGGLVQSTRSIVKSFFGSPVPIVVYVAPAGSRAASAGVFITMAAHVAAMAPGTHIGAAHPVSIGGGAPGDGAPADTSESVMDEKVMNDIRAWARSIAESRGRNADWAEEAVTRSVSIVAEEALAENVVDVIAADISSLLEEIEGREVDLDTGRTTLRTAGAVVETIEMWWGERILGALSNPNVAFLLLVLGFYGVVFEFYSGGWGVPGTVGALCLLLGFFGLAILPINIIGLLFILAGMGLFVTEAFVPSFGLLTVGGVVCLILGGLMLVDSPMGIVEVSKSVVIPVAVASGVIAFFLMGQVVRAYRTPHQTGQESFVRQPAIAVEDFRPHEGAFTGMVMMQGELWTAFAPGAITEGSSVRIVGRSGLVLNVEAAEEGG